jgi:hypothetical protein
VLFFYISIKIGKGRTFCVLPFPEYQVYNLLLETVLLVELVNAAAGVDQLLLAGVEGMALGADFNGDILLCGTGLDYVAAGALDGGLLVIRMNSFFHIK